MMAYLRLCNCVLVVLCAAACCSATPASVKREQSVEPRSPDVFALLLQKSSRQRADDAVNSRRNKRADDDNEAPTFPGGFTIPTIPENFTLPTLPGDLTLPTLPETLPSITTPTLPGGQTLPPDATLPATLPPDATFPPNFTIPSLPETLPTIPDLPNITLPTLPFNITIPPNIFENVTLPPFETDNFTIPPDFTLPPELTNFTLPPVDNFTFPNFTLPPPFDDFTLPPDIADQLDQLLAGNVIDFPAAIGDLLNELIVGNFTLPPPFDNFTLSPDIVDQLEQLLAGNVTDFPSAIGDFLNELIAGNFTLPPPFDNFTLSPDIIDQLEQLLSGDVTDFPSAISDLLNEILASDFTNLASGIADLVSQLSALTSDVIPDFIGIDSLLRAILINDVSDECSQGWTALFNTTDGDGASDGLRAVDAFGKLGAGYLQGNMYALGSYDECFGLSDTKYCLSDLVVTFDSGSNVELFYAICMPKACSIDDIEQAINSTNDQLSFFNVTFDISSISCENDSQPSFNAGAGIVILIWCLFGALVLGATAVHLVMLTIQGRNNRCKEGLELPSENTSSMEGANDEKKSTISKLAFSFSLYKAVPAIISTERPKRVITSLHGVKVLSLLWIILGHTHLWSLFFNSNSLHIEENVVTRFSYQAVLSSPFGFDSFFLVSGVLIAYVALHKMCKNKSELAKSPSKRRYVTLITDYIRRLLHFSPVYAIILFTFWLLTVHFADGPLWRKTVGDGSMMYENCEKYWWTNLFYINNLYPWANIDECMPWSWYISTEIQFFVAAPLIIIPLALFYPVGLAIAGLLLVANVATIGGIAGKNKLSANIFLDVDVSTDTDDIVPDGPNSIDDIHTKPWTRVGPFIVGILLGFILFKKRQPTFRKQLNCVFYIICLWLIAAGLCYGTVYGLHGAYGDEDTLTEGEEIVYQMFSRLSWSLGVAIIIYVNHNGYGGIINDFLSMKIWTPLSRLSLITYLIHPIVLFVLFYTSRSPIYSTNITLAVYTIATVVLSFGAAGIVAALVDVPLRNLETAILKMVGLGVEQGTPGGVLQEDMEEGVVVHENYYFKELEREEQKRMEADVEEGEAATEQKLEKSEI